MTQVYQSAKFSRLLRLISYMQYDLGYVNLEEKTLQSLDNLLPIIDGE